MIEFVRFEITEAYPRVCGIGYIVYSEARLLINLKKNARHLLHLLMFNDFQPSSLYTLSLDVSFHALVMPRPAEY